MQNYLSGRGYDDGAKADTPSSFRPFLEKNSIGGGDGNSQNEINAKVNELDSEIIYNEANCPKVEVLSEEGVPQKIIIHLEDGRLLEIGCRY